MAAVRSTEEGAVPFIFSRVESFSDCIIQPMFVLMSDGGSTESKLEPESADYVSETSCVLLQRVLLFKIITAGISVVLFDTSEQRDDKVCLNAVTMRG